LVALSVACSASTEPSSTTQDAESDTATSETATDTGAATDTSAEDTAGACNTLANAAPEITSATTTAAMPAPTGGTIVDGTYFLTASTVYESTSTGSKLQETITIAGGTLSSVKRGVTNPTDRTTWSYSTSGTTVTVTRTCPSSKTQMLGFTAGGATLTTFDTVANISKTYTKQ
jgi:hypothetical protein